MSHWDEPVPPNRMARWVASHLRLLEITWAVFAVAYGTFIVLSWMSDGQGEAIILLPSLVGFVAGGLGFRQIARVVRRYDEHVARRNVRDTD